VRRGKPAPDAYIEAARRLARDPRECVVIEDAPVGVEAGRASGGRVVGVATTHSRRELAGADFVIDDLTALSTSRDVNRLLLHVTSR
jgi:sugar-phosphatase